MGITSTLEKIYNRHYGLFCKLGQEGFGLDIETTHDLIHEAFEKTYRNKGNIASTTESGIRSYIIRTFRNECIRYKRQQARLSENTKAEPEYATHMSTGIKTCDVLNEILLIEEYRLRDTVIKMINSEKWQEPVRLHLQGLKTKEIAERLNRKFRTTQTLIRRGMREYERIIKELDPLRKM